MNIADRFPKSFSPEQLEFLDQAARLADRHKKKVVLVGGVVRDLLLKIQTRDADIMFEHPDKKLMEGLAAHFKGELVSHERFLTFTITLPNGFKFDLVTAREETYAAPGQLPNVTASSIEKDLKRRDFTINAIACGLNKKQRGETFDPLKGDWDLQNKLIRAMHDQSFVDDPTRIYRAARFAARLGFKIEPDTQKWIQESVATKGPAVLSPVRRRHEFELILKEENPVLALQMLKDWGAFVYLHPDFNQVDLSVVRFEPNMAFELRLVRWFQGWNKSRALEIMTDLGFEKTVKKSVSALL